MRCRLQENWLQELKKYIAHEERIDAWKTLQVLPFTQYNVALISPVENNFPIAYNLPTWYIGNNFHTKRERKNRDLTTEEIGNKEVTEGLHAFLDQKDAEDFTELCIDDYEKQNQTRIAPFNFKPFVTLPVSIDPSETIAVGNCSFGTAKTIVTTVMYLKPFDVNELKSYTD